MIGPEGNVEERGCRRKSAKFDLALKTTPTVDVALERVSVTVGMEANENGDFWF